MANQNEPKKQVHKVTSREDRLKAELKANLGRRKAQAKVRTSASKEQKPQGDLEE